MPFRPPIGQSDFRNLRREGLTYVDKTALISRLLADSSLAILLARPRRFGKTLNLSTLRYFLERPPEGEDRADLFEGLQVWQDMEARRHFQRHPVLSLTFKDQKHGSWAECEAGFQRLLSQLYREHRWLLQHPSLSQEERRTFEAALDGRVSLLSLEPCLLELSELLHRATGEQAVILVDEYDTPLQRAWLSGYYDEAIGFFRRFLGAGLKDNRHLYKGVLTGVLRIARESIFSDLNNLSVHTLLSSRYATDFGFTEPEVDGLVGEAGLADTDGLRDWYNGYLFGGRTVYNPWSVLSYLAQPADGLQPYWANTAGNELLLRLIASGEAAVSRDVEALIRGEILERRIDENLVLRDLDSNPAALWSLLLLSGYLKPVLLRRDDDGLFVSLALPNREVRQIWRLLFRDWLTQRAGTEGVGALLDALLHGDEPALEGRLQELVLRSLSSFDVEKRQPERVYHAFTLGLLVHLAADYDVKSNPEAGYGRADVLVIPRRPGLPGAVIEFKRLAERQRPEAALRAALRQIADNDYVSTLRAAGATPIHAWGVVFDGKRVRVRYRAA